MTLFLTLLLATVFGVVSSCPANQGMATPEALGHSFRNEKRLITVGATNPGSVPFFYQALYMCNMMIAKALALLANTSNPNLFYIFGDESDRTRTTVINILSLIDDTCTGKFSPNTVIFLDEEVFLASMSPSTRTTTEVQSEPTTTSTVTTTFVIPTPICGRTVGDTEGVSAYSWPLDNTIVLCPGFFSVPMFPPSQDNCFQPSAGGHVIHELSHLPEVTNWPPYLMTDYEYYSDILLIEDFENRLNNADSYAMYATHAWLGCTNGILPGET